MSSVCNYCKNEATMLCVNLQCVPSVFLHNEDCYAVEPEFDEFCPWRDVPLPPLD